MIIVEALTRIYCLLSFIEKKLQKSNLPKVNSEFSSMCALLKDL